MRVRHFRHIVRHFVRHFQPSNGGASTLPTLFFKIPLRARACVCGNVFFTVGSVGSVGNTINTLNLKGKIIRQFFRHFEKGVFTSVGDDFQQASEVTHG